MSNDNRPLISVIMSVYNEQEYIEDAVKSVLDQTESDFELIIIDDCSTDDTVRIIEGLNDDRIILVRNEENRGLTKNLNRALEMAKGEYIARMDGDDISEPTRFEKQVSYLKAHPDIMLISCNTVTFGEQKLVSDMGGSPEELRCTMLLRPVLAHPGFMFRSALYREYEYKYDEHFISAQDYDLASRVVSPDKDPSKGLKIGITDDVLIKYRNHKGQVSTVNTGKQFAYACEVRKRLFGQLDMELSESEIEAYNKWVTESDASKDEFLLCMQILNRILQQNKTIYDTAVLKSVLMKNYFKWILRSNGKHYMWKICGTHPDRYARLFGTGIKMIASRIRRQSHLNRLERGGCDA